MDTSVEKNRKGIKQELVGYFPDREPIWVITDRLSEKEDLENGFNRETIRLMNIDDLIINAEASLIKGQPHASLIITEHLPTGVEQHFREVVKALNLMPNVKVYEINRDPVFEYGVEMGSIRQLIVLSKDKTRSETIKEFTDPTDKQADIMRSLEEDIVILKSQLEDEKKAKGKVEEEKKEALRRLKEMASEVKNRYLPDKERFKKLADQLQNELDGVKIDLEQEKSKTNKYRKEKDEALDRETNLEYAVKALENRIKNKDERIELLNAEVARKEKEINKVVLERDRVLGTMVEEEQALLLETHLKEEREEKERALGEVESLRVSVREKEFNINELERTISNLRQGNDSVKNTGRTNLLDTQRLQNTDLVYIKVIDHLPYHKLAIKMLFDLLNNKKYNQRGCMIILKNDEGLDHENFKGINVVGDLDDLHREADIVRLYPSTSMFSGIESFENEYDFVLVLDYIQSNQYYLDTNARSHFMTMVKSSDRVQKISGLKGSPLSIDSDSIFSLRFDPAIGNAAFKENRHNALFNKVHQWYLKLNVTQ